MVVSWRRVVHDSRHLERALGSGCGCNYSDISDLRVLENAVLGE